MTDDGALTPDWHPTCKRCGTRLRWLGEPHHPENPNAWECPEHGDAHV